MSGPEQALAQARLNAERMRAEGAYADSAPLRPGPAASEVSEATELKLYQWALIEPDPGKVRSTRRFGAPLTALKRMLLRLLVQYHMQLTGEQTRFNVALVGYVKRLELRTVELEARIEALEQRAER